MLKGISDIMLFFKGTDKPKPMNGDWVYRVYEEGQEGLCLGYIEYWAKEYLFGPSSLLNSHFNLPELKQLVEKIEGLNKKILETPP